MEVNPNAGTGPADRIVSRQPVSPRAKGTASDSVHFQKSNAIGNALQKTSDVRPDAVQRGKELAADLQYPPLVTIRAISRLLAGHMGAGEE